MLIENPTVVKLTPQSIKLLDRQELSEIEFVNDAARLGDSAILIDDQYKAYCSGLQKLGFVI